MSLTLGTVSVNIKTGKVTYSNAAHMVPKIFAQMVAGLNTANSAIKLPPKNISPEPLVIDTSVGHKESANGLNALAGMATGIGTALEDILKNDAVVSGGSIT